MFSRSALLVALLLTACGTGGAQPSATDDGSSRVHEFAAALRRSVQYDYDIHESPEALRGDSDLVVVGRLTEVTGGRTIMGIGEHATFTIEVDEVLAGPSGKALEGRVYLELVTNPVGTVERYRAALPPSRVLLFLDDRTDIESSDGTGAPLGAPIFALQSPLGFIIEDGSRFLGAYEDLGSAPPAWTESESFDELVASMRGGN